MHPVLFTTTIGNIELVILSAKFFGVLAYIVSGLFFYHKAVKLGLNKERLLLVILLGLYILYFAGRLIPFFYNWVKFNRPPIFFYTSYMSYSSILVFILVIIFYSRANKWKAYQLLDIYALANLLDGAINRVGCFLNGCCFGKPTNLPWGCRFGSDGVVRHPAQIYSCIADLALFFILLHIYNKKRKFDGEIFWLYVFYYSVFRFLIEFIRTNPVFWLGLTHAQWFSLFAIILGKYALRILRQRQEPKT